MGLQLYWGSVHNKDWLGYLSLQEDEQIDIVWWYKKLWKFKAPPSILLFWFILKNQILTWAYMQKRGFEGPGLCGLCRGANEDTSYHFYNAHLLDKSGIK